MLDRTSESDSRAHCEESDSYRGELFRFGCYRVAICRDGLQWLYQRQGGQFKAGGARWRTLGYCVTRNALTGLHRAANDSDAPEIARLPATFPNSLRYTGDCWHPTAQRFPALLAYIGGTEGFALHRTYLKKDGQGKANVAPAKVMLGQTKGGAVRLSDGPGPLVVTEGIETGLSLLSGLIAQPATVWAALSAGGMRALRLPDIPGKLIIAADGDPVWLNSAEHLAERAYGIGWQVSLLPAPTGCDWNDVLTGKAQAA